MMAGVKGKSGGPRAGAGGPRANAGGARPGAGRPKSPPELIAPKAFDGKTRFASPLEFLLAVMNDASADAKIRVDAAKALLPFKHQRQGEARQDQLALALESSGDKWAGLLQ